MSQSKDVRGTVCKKLGSYVLEQNVHKYKFLENELNITTIVSIIRLRTLFQIDRVHKRGFPCRVGRIRILVMYREVVM